MKIHFQDCKCKRWKFWLLPKIKHGIYVDLLPDIMALYDGKIFMINKNKKVKALYI